MVRSRRRDEETVMPEQEGQAPADLEALLALYREARDQVAEVEIELQHGEAELGGL
jgi:hypothetical protein